MNAGKNATSHFCVRGVVGCCEDCERATRVLCPPDHIVSAFFSAFPYNVRMDICGWSTESNCDFVQFVRICAVRSTCVSNLK